MDGERERDVFVELRNFGGFDGWDSLVERNVRQLHCLDGRDAAAIDELKELPNMFVADVLVEVVEQDAVLVEDGWWPWNDPLDRRHPPIGTVVVATAAAATGISWRALDDDLDETRFATDGSGERSKPIIDSDIT